MSSSTRLVVLAPPEVEPGYLLAGVDVRRVETAADAAAELDRLAAEGEQGVIAIYRPLFEDLEPERRRRLELSLRPVVVALPTGLGDTRAGDRHAHLMQRLQRAIGYHITFGEEEG